MKKTLCSLLFLLPLASFAQGSSDSVSLDLLRAPASPAFNLLGISPSVIERPTDLNAFRVSIQNASNNFSALPNSYAVEFAPAALARLPNQTLDKFNSKKFRDFFTQTLSLSIGMTRGTTDDGQTSDSVSFTKLGFGIKFSLLRPDWDDETKEAFNKLIAAQRAFLQNVMDRDTSAKRIALQNLLQQINREMPSGKAKDDSVIKVTLQLANINADFTNAINNQLRDSTSYLELKTAARNFRIARKGPFLDFAGGIAIDFPDDRFEYSLTSKAGAWLTGGYENGNSGFTALGILRYLYQPDKVFADDNGVVGKSSISTLDAGARLMLTAMDSRFVVSAEGIYRSVLNKDVIDPSWRFTFNTEYDIGANRKLTLAIGRNFDGTLSKSGNLIAALNFIAGFGSSKKISGQ